MIKYRKENNFTDEIPDKVYDEFKAKLTNDDMKPLSDISFDEFLKRAAKHNTIKAGIDYGSLTDLSDSYTVMEGYRLYYLGWVNRLLDLEDVELE
jgi:hypothetical protein